MKEGLCKTLAFITGEAMTHSDFYLEIVARREDVPLYETS